jgi:hypothetical protein
MYTKWIFRTTDRPGICFGSPGAVPIEMAHFWATILIEVKIALRARSRVRAATRVDPECASRKNRGVLNALDGNFSIFVIYTGIVVKTCLLAP